MERVRIAALFADKEQYGGASVTVCGWAKTIRDMKTFGFIELNDGPIFQDRVPLEVKSIIDTNNDNNVWQGRARFGAGFVDWRFIAVGNMSTGTNLT